MVGTINPAALPVMVVKVKQILWPGCRGACVAIKGLQCPFEAIERVNTQLIMVLRLFHV